MCQKLKIYISELILNNYEYNRISKNALHDFTSVKMSLANF